MIVIDASAMIEALVGREANNDLLDALQTSVHAPHLLDVEVLSVLWSRVFWWLPRRRAGCMS